MKMNKLVPLVMMLSALSAFAVTPQVKNVRAFQQYPWGIVGISYEVVGDVAEITESGKTPILFIIAKNKNTGLVYGDVSSEESFLTGDTGMKVGLHKVVWDIRAQGIAIDSDNVVFTVVYCDVQPFLVVDLSSGAYSLSPYPSSYLYEIPSDGWTDVHKTTKLVLRRIVPGSFKMCGQHDVTLTKPFYMGIFEVTQKQYALVMGSNPSKYLDDKSPVHNISYDIIRGTMNGAQWPLSSEVDSTSFIGKLQARTRNVSFDLPTEAQWEYACRAGTTNDYNNGSNSMSGLAGVKSSRPSNVGSYKSNAWELYDMHGNVGEWCLDRFASLSTGGMNPVGPSSGTKRVVRGGGSYSYITGGGYREQASAPSTSRAGLSPSDAYYYDNNGYGFCNESFRGFRLAATFSD